jgi:hypothetical protein
MGATNIQRIPHGKAGTLADGKAVNVRSESSYETPTLEIHDKKTGKRIKIRYIG